MIRAGGRRRGFSLLELAIVVAIAAILAAMALPRYAGALSRYHAEAAARRIAADLALARDRARTYGAQRSVTFNPAAEQYQIPGLRDLKSSSGDYVVNLADRPYRADLVSADFGGDATVVFDGYGVPDGGGQVVVQVGEYQKTVVLDPNTGKAAVQ